MNSDFEPEEVDDFDPAFDGSFFMDFEADAYSIIAPIIKGFLATYYGDVMTELESETYLDIEAIIKDSFMYEVSLLPDLLYAHRSITDNETFETALNSYVRSSDTVITWPRPECWFDRDFGSADDDEDTYLEDSDPIDLTEEERTAKQVIALADEMRDHHLSLAQFSKRGYEVIVKAMQAYLEAVAIFDLEILTEEGMHLLQQDLFLTITEMLDHLYGIIEADLKSKR